MVLVTVAVEYPRSACSRITRVGARFIQPDIERQVAGQRHTRAIRHIAVGVLRVSYLYLHRELAVDLDKSDLRHIFGRTPRRRDRSGRRVIVYEHVAVAVFGRDGRRREISGLGAVAARVEIAGFGHELARVLAVGRRDDSVSHLKGLERLAARIGFVNIILVQLGHDDVPSDCGRVPRKRAERQLLLIISEPDSADIIGRVADKPTVDVARRRTRFTGDVDTAFQCDCRRGTAVDDILEHLRHYRRGLLADYDIAVSFVFEQHVALVVENVQPGARLVVDAAVREYLICRGDFEVGHAVGHSSQSKRSPALVGDADAARKLGVFDKAVHLQLVLDKVKRTIERQILQYPQRDRVYRARDRVVHRRQTIVYLRQVFRICRRIFLFDVLIVIVEPDRHVVVNRAVGDESGFERGSVDRQRLYRRTG